MPNRNTSDETDKLDHATHPTTHSTPEDLRAPGGGSAGARREEKPREQPEKGGPANAPAGPPEEVTPSRP